jgi:alpha-mannosidase
LKATFPLSVSNPKATYNWGMGTIERGNNEPTKYEVPSHEWLDLTDGAGEYGVSILDDSKYGSDKPADNELRLTLLYTPGVRNGYLDQHSQDWGRHERSTHCTAAKATGRRAVNAGRRLNQPLQSGSRTAEGAEKSFLSANAINLTFGQLANTGLSSRVQGPSTRSQEYGITMAGNPRGGGS